MTIATPDVVRIDESTASSASSALGVLVGALYETTIRERSTRDTRLRDLAEWSTSEDGLDWDALARINIEGWGADEESA